MTTGAAAMMRDWEGTPFFRAFGLRAQQAPARLAVPGQRGRIRGIRDGTIGGVIASFLEAAVRGRAGEGPAGRAEPGSTRAGSASYLFRVQGDAGAGTLCTVTQVTRAVRERAATAGEVTAR